MAETTTLVGGNVQGDITSCKVENQVKSEQVNSAFSITKTTTYITYNVCDKQIISEYSKPEVTLIGGFYILVAILLVFVVAAVIFDRY